MKTFKVYWSPEGRCIATVQAKDARAAKRKAPQPYRRYLGEMYCVEVRRTAPVRGYGRFPVHASHATVVCFTCGASVPSVGDSEGDAPGHGQFVSLRCPMCKQRTWYDILTNRVLLEGAGDACTTILGARLVMHAHEYLLKQGRLDVD